MKKWLIDGIPMDYKQMLGYAINKGWPFGVDGDKVVARHPGAYLREIGCDIIFTYPRDSREGTSEEEEWRNGGRGSSSSPSEEVK